MVARNGGDRVGIGRKRSVSSSCEVPSWHQGTEGNTTISSKGRHRDVVVTVSVVVVILAYNGAPGSEGTIRQSRS